MFSRKKQYSLSIYISDKANEMQVIELIKSLRKHKFDVYIDEMDTVGQLTPIIRKEIIPLSGKRLRAINNHLPTLPIDLLNKIDFFNDEEVTYNFKKG